MISKAKVQESIANMPENFTIDELVERLIFIEKVEQGLKDSREGNTISEKELDAKMKERFK